MSLLCKQAADALAVYGRINGVMSGDVALLIATLRATSEWKLVPIEPTPEMLDAAVGGLLRGPVGLKVDAKMRSIYQSMVKAVPEKTS